MRTTASTIVLIILCLAAGCMLQQPRATATRAYSTDHVAGAAVEIETRNGAVEITADPDIAQVQVEATITCTGGDQDEADGRLAEATVEMARDTAGKLTITPVFPGGTRSGDSAGLRVRLPQADGAMVRTSNGRIGVSGLSGALVVKTSNGAVTVNNHAGPAEIESSNGAIRVRELGGTLRAKTSNGAIDAAGVAGAATLTTSNGPITLVLAADQPGPIHLRTSNGAVKASVGRGFAGTVKMATSNGAVTVVDQANRAKSKSLAKRSGTVVLSDGGEPSDINSSNGRIELVIQQ